MKNYCLIILLSFSFLSQAQTVDIPDVNFKNALVNTNCVDTNGDGVGDVDADTNNDGEIQESEAEAVLMLRVSDESISSLEGIQSFTNLEFLFCYNNELTSLDFTQNPNLERLLCYNNQLSSLDVTQNPNLLILYCDENQITNLDITQNPNIKVVSCTYNQLTSIDVSQNSILELLFCQHNQLINLNIKNGNNQSITDMWAFDNPDLDCIEVDDENYANNQKCEVPDNSWCKDDWVAYSEICALGTEDFIQLSFSLYPNPAQDILHIESQELFDSVNIYSIEGILVRETTNTSINVSELPSGIYFIQMNIEGNKVIKKFIKS